MIHSTAIIEQDVKLGSNVKIGPYSYLSGKVTVGNNTVIDSHVRIEGNVTIGNNNRIFHSAYIGAPPQDVSYKDQETYVRIGDNNIIREFVQIHRGTVEASCTELGSDCFVMGGAHLAHNVKVGNSVTIANYSALAGYVQIDDFSFISGLCGFHQFVRVGKYVMVGGMARVGKDCPPFMIIEGSPPRVAGINVVGLRRRGFTQERRNAIKKAYRVLFRSGKNVTQAVEELSGFGHCEDINEILNFIRSSERGIVR